jgi:hypothetical protein
VVQLELAVCNSLLTFIVFQVLTAANIPEAGQREIEEMVMNHDIEKVIVVKRNRLRFTKG